jgi:hypothetical protein
MGLPQEKEDFVDISVSAKKGQPIQTQPDPATVVTGEHVAWKFYYDGPDPVSWKVYFSAGSPFEKWENGSVQGNGRLEGGQARTPGDYKYGIRLTNALSNQIMCDDDPRLIVG